MAGLSAAAMLPPEAAGAGSGLDTTTDPIFPVIAAYKEAVAERMNYLESDQQTDQARAADHCDREFESFHRLFDTSPTTVGGMAALLDQLAANPYNDEHMTGPQSVIEMAFDMDRKRTNAALAGEPVLAI